MGSGKRVLVMTVGTGGGVEDGIARCIDDRRPDEVVFLVTAMSETKVKLVEEKARRMPSHRCVPVADHEELSEAYRVARDVIRGVKRTQADAEVEVDFTSGTKVMSAAAVLAGLAEDCRDFVYVGGGRRDSETGRVTSGAETLRTMRPYCVLADIWAQRAVELFNAYEFQAALAICERAVGGRDLPAFERRPFEVLAVLCRAYQSWDAFDLETAARGFAEARKAAGTQGIDLHDAEQFPRFTENSEWVKRLNNLLTAFQREEVGRRTFPLEFVVDVVANADRRMEGGKWVDAVSRLYRAVELVAQHVLSERYRIDTGAVNTDLIPAEAREKYEAYRDDSGRLRLGLEQAYSLLRDLNHPLGRCFFEAEAMRARLRARNDSIAAHGLAPVTPEACRSLYEPVAEWLRELNAPIAQMKEQATFMRLSRGVLDCEGREDR
ncbi:MAG: TIGR02710 family CRISPR-associated protein [Acetobacteraceae bacterium]|nr:TIGR02710 family CRISPR-associated protein [Acetobacteraceae bacterium]